MLLVTGAAGYLGAATVAVLVERGVAVRALVRDPARATVLSDGVERVAADSYCALAGRPYRVRARAPGATLGAGASLFARRSEVYGKLGAIRVDDAQARALGFRPRGVDEGLRFTAT